MRMRHVAVPLGRVCLFCDDVVSAGLADAFPVEDDSERAQFHVFEHDRGREHADVVFFEVEFSVLEFLLQCLQVGGDLAGCSNLLRSRFGRQLFTEPFQVPLNTAARVMQVVAQGLGGDAPASALHVSQPLDGAAQFIPGSLRKVIQRRPMCRSQQMLVNLDGGTQRPPSVFGLCGHGHFSWRQMAVAG